MVEFYNRTKPDSRLDQLTPLMVSKNAGAPPKLRGKGAEVRGLVAFGVEVAQRHFDLEDTFQATAYQAARKLQACYEGLDAERFDPTTMANNSRQLALLLAALDSTASAPLWRMKPKVHLMQELLEYGLSRPSETWLYRDEDFGGTVATMAKHRGGHSAAHTVGMAVLNKFAARHAVPVVR